MSSEDTGQEKTLPATQRQINKAKEQGNFPRSKEVTMVATLLTPLFFFWMARDYMIERSLIMGRRFLSFDPFLNLSSETLGELFRLALGDFLPLVLPLFLIVMVTGMVAEVAQVGVRFIQDPFGPKWENLDPVKNFKKKYNIKAPVEGLKSFSKLAIITLIVFITVRTAMPRIVATIDQSPLQALKSMVGVGLQIGFRVCGLLLFIVGLDYWFQRWQYFKNLRMSHQDMRDEMKQTEGDPLIKSRIRSIQMEIARKRMMAEAPNADFILTNPTHYAVAIKYDPIKRHAPYVVAKGQNYIAQKIREIAKAEGIPIIENPPLAREIYRKTKVGEAIPSHLFQAVAQIMASIWHLASRRGARWRDVAPTTARG